MRASLHPTVRRGLLALLLVWLAACAPEPDAPPAPDSTQTTRRADSTDTDARVAPLYPAREVVEAPDFTLTTLDGTPFTLSDHRGEVVVLNFWATWCAPCREEMPAFVALQREWGGRGLQFVGVSLDEDAEEMVRGFADMLGVNYPVGIDDGTVEPLYGPLSVMPTTYMLDRKGHVRYYVPGSVTRAALEPALLELLDER